MVVSRAGVDCISEETVRSLVSIQHRTNDKELHSIEWFQFQYTGYNEIPANQVRLACPGSSLFLQFLLEGGKRMLQVCLPDRNGQIAACLFQDCPRGIGGTAQTPGYGVGKVNRGK